MLQKNGKAHRPRVSGWMQNKATKRANGALDQVRISVILFIGISQVLITDAPIMPALQSAVKRYHLWIFKRIKWT